MSVQITVRLPDAEAAHLDRAVARGRARSRAELVAYLLAQDRQRQQALDDLDLLREQGALPTPYGDLAGIAAATSRRRLDLD